MPRGNPRPTGRGCPERRGAVRAPGRTRRAASRRPGESPEVMGSGTPAGDVGYAAHRPQSDGAVRLEGAAPDLGKGSGSGTRQPGPCTAGVVGHVTRRWTVVGREADDVRPQRQHPPPISNGRPSDPCGAVRRNTQSPGLRSRTSAGKFGRPARSAVGASCRGGNSESRMAEASGSPDTKTLLAPLGARVAPVPAKPAGSAHALAEVEALRVNLPAGCDHLGVEALVLPTTSERRPPIRTMPRVPASGSRIQRSCRTVHPSGINRCPRRAATGLPRSGSTAHCASTGVVPERQASRIRAPASGRRRHGRWRCPTTTLLAVG